MIRTFQVTSICEYLKPIRARDYKSPLVFVNSKKVFIKPYLIKKLFIELKKMKIKEVTIEDNANEDNIIISFGRAEYYFKTVPNKS